MNPDNLVIFRSSDPRASMHDSSQGNQAHSDDVTESPFLLEIKRNR